MSIGALSLRECASGDGLAVIPKAGSKPYSFDQLVPYIGNKRKLLPLICKAISATGIDGGTFFDVFAGTGVVSRCAKTLGFRVVANDWEPYSRVLNTAYVAVNTAPPFEKLGGIDGAIKTLNGIAGVRGYISTHYCPEHDEHYEVDRERMFYTQENGRRIDAMRDQIAEWRECEAIDTVEEDVLLAPLLYQASYCSNTSGVFKGFHRGWGGATKTAWYRIRSRLMLSPPVFLDNGLRNDVYAEDAAQLAEQVRCDIAYLDPPYNQHQYGANYHMLNTIALWDKPPLNKHYVQGSGDKSAIRIDWRTSRRSAYCSRTTATGAFDDLVNRLKARFILVSYSTEGIIPVEDMFQCLAQRGALSVHSRPYKRYRVSSQRPSPRPHTTEFVAVVDTSTRGRTDDARRAVERLLTGDQLLICAD